MSDLRFPGAPAGSYVSEDGWLITGQEAWTAEEWAGEWGVAYRARRHGGALMPQRGRPKYATDEERREAARRSSREYMRRRREDEYQARQRGAA